VPQKVLAGLLFLQSLAMSGRIIYMLLDTPIECYNVANRQVWVKREDLCAPKDWPPFSKVRGLYAYLRRRKEQGLKVVGYAETSVSMAGWAVAAAAKVLEMKAVIFPPEYKNPEARHDIAWLNYHHKMWQQWGAEIIPTPATRHQISWYRGRTYLHDKYGLEAEMLPIGISFEESVEATANVFHAVSRDKRCGAVVACIGSGTIFSGLMRGWQAGDGQLWGVAVRAMDPVVAVQECAAKACTLFGGLLGKSNQHIHIVVPGWQYYQTASIDCPFPCHQFYDLKAWQWLVENIDNLPDPILFWNIGHSPVTVKIKETTIAG
jgi:1-aminocyclopropane-1-carboxylate deaminase/D-cysteine desulfhydrase-like pyridoxal-dependent ACC family enzyme